MGSVRFSNTTWFPPNEIIPLHILTYFIRNPLFRNANFM